MSVSAISQSSSTSASATSGSSGSALGSMDATFLNLLITELKSQDPTAPMDANQMVGQMIALNQLDQLIGIHQLLQTAGSDAANSTASPANGGY